MELSWGVRDLTRASFGAPTLAFEEVVPDPDISHLTLLLGVVEGVREEKDEEGWCRGVKEAVLFRPTHLDTLMLLGVRSSWWVCTEEGDVGGGGSDDPLT